MGREKKKTGNRVTKDRKGEKKKKTGKRDPKDRKNERKKQIREERKER